MVAVRANLEVVEVDQLLEISSFEGGPLDQDELDLLVALDALAHVVHASQLGVEVENVPRVSRWYRVVLVTSDTCNFWWWQWWLPADLDQVVAYFARDGHRLSDLDARQTSRHFGVDGVIGG